MNNTSKEFLTSDLKSFDSICLLGITGFIFLMGVLDFITDEKVIGSTMVSVFLLPFFPILLLIKLTSKIKFDNDFVEKRTMTSRTQIKWKDVKSFGVYVDHRPFMPKVVDAREVERHIFLARHFIFISTGADFDPINQKSEECIVLGYRKNIYDNVRETLENNNSKR